MALTTQVQVEEMRARIGRIDATLRELPEGYAEQIAPRLSAERSTLLGQVEEMERVDVAVQQQEEERQKRAIEELDAAVSSFQASARDLLTQVDLPRVAANIHTAARHLADIRDGYSAVAAQAARSRLRVPLLADLIGVPENLMHAIAFTAARLDMAGQHSTAPTPPPPAAAAASPRPGRWGLFSWGRT